MKDYMPLIVIAIIALVLNAKKIDTGKEQKKYPDEK